jgi:hypothetical protein
MTRELTEEQAWDEYLIKLEEYKKELDFWQTVETHISSLKNKITKRWEEDCKPLMPYVKDRLLEQIENMSHKYREAPTAAEIEAYENGNL